MGDIKETEKYKKAFQAVNDLFSDPSVPAESTRELLELLRDEIDILITSIVVED